MAPLAGLAELVESILAFQHAVMFLASI